MVAEAVEAVTFSKQHCSFRSKGVLVLKTIRDEDGDNRWFEYHTYPHRNISTTYNLIAIARCATYDISKFLAH